MTLQPSGHNIVVPLDSSGRHLLVNVLSGHADVLSEEEYGLLGNLPDGQVPHEFIEKGYVADPAEEERRYKLAYIDFLENREKEELQLFFVPTYNCNFTCSYCYQGNYPAEKNRLSHQVTDAFFAFVQQRFGERNKYITLFGGEPLLPSPAHKAAIEYFLLKAQQANIDIAIVTNGYHLGDYLPVLNESFVREIQVTLDGTRQVHDQRRTLQSGAPTFDVISANIDKCLKKNISVNLRMVVDRHNISNLSELALYAAEKGWTSHPLFKTQIGRNYELHYCQDGRSLLFDRLTLYQELYELIRKNPHIVEFHKPAFSVMKFLQENGKLPGALFDACPACKSEWAMDFTGSIYSCTATVGKPGEKLGTFFPESVLDEEKISIWQQRDVMHIEKCRQCNVQLICGGGCGSLALNQSGHIHSPDCRPVADLISLGAKAYFDLGNND